MKQIFIYILFFIQLSLFSQDYSYEYYGILHESKVNTTLLNVRSNPSINSEIISQLHLGDRVVVSGVSRNIDQIGENVGYWLRLWFEEKQSFGWVFSLYIEGFDGYKPSTINVIRPETRINQWEISYQVLNVEIQRNNNVYKQSILIDQVEGQNFVTFIWNIGTKGYSYNDVPGSYLYNLSTNELRFMRYINDTLETAWIRYTDDLKYGIQDFGTSPTFRGFSVFNTSTNEILYNGGYSRDLIMEGNTVEMIRGQRFLEENNLLDDLELLKKFVLENPLDYMNEQERMYYWPVIIYRLNLDTGEIVFNRCEYVFD